MKKYLKKCISLIFILGIIFSAIFSTIDFYVQKTSQKYLIGIDNAPKADAIIVLGAYVFPDGKVSEMLGDRLDYAYKLYKKKKAHKIVVSGDHSRKDYDEVNAMRKYLQEKGVSREDIFMDHAGFDTYDTIYRARDIFLIKKPILVSQGYHVRRAVFIARKLGLKAYGLASDKRQYAGMWYYRIREVAARVKAFLQAEITKPKPGFLGKVIPIWKNGRMTDDGL